MNSISLQPGKAGHVRRWVAARVKEWFGIELSSRTRDGSWEEDPATEAINAYMVTVKPLAGQIDPMIAFFDGTVLTGGMTIAMTQEEARRSKFLRVREAIRREFGEVDVCVEFKGDRVALSLEPKEEEAWA